MHVRKMHFENASGETLLQKAATNGHTDVCRFLITQGAKINSNDQDQQTPLMWAAGARPVGPVGWQKFGKMLLVFGCIGTDICK